MLPSCCCRRTQPTVWCLRHWTTPRRVNGHLETFLSIIQFFLLLLQSIKKSKFEIADRKHWNDKLLLLNLHKNIWRKRLRIRSGLILEMVFNPPESSTLKLTDFKSEMKLRKWNFFRKCFWLFFLFFCFFKRPNITCYTGRMVRQQQHRR